MSMREHNREVIRKHVLETKRMIGPFVALREAVRWDAAEIVEELIQSGVDPNERTTYGQGGGGTGRTLLMFCHSKKVGEILLRNGADVLAKDDEGRTALIWFFYTGLYRKSTARAYLRWLLSLGADPNDVDNGESARSLAKDRY